MEIAFTTKWVYLINVFILLFCVKLFRVVLSVINVDGGA